jgi:membrane protease YdiL (CAAX protease family)
LVGGTVGTVLIVIGGFGAMLAAAIIIRYSGDSLAEWLRKIVRWRVPIRFYAYALGLPVLIMATMNGMLAALGQQLDVSLPALEERHAPLVATLILGLGWGVWHIPLYGPVGFLVPLVLAFFYSWLYNRTQSVLLCILLHGSFTAAQDHLLLSADSQIVDAVLLGTYLVGAGVLIAVTRGRLGLPLMKICQIENEEDLR